MASGRSKWILTWCLLGFHGLVGWSNATKRQKHLGLNVAWIVGIWKGLNKIQHMFMENIQKLKYISKFFSCCRILSIHQGNLHDWTGKTLTHRCSMRCLCCRLVQGLEFPDIFIFLFTISEPIQTGSFLSPIIWYSASAHNKHNIYPFWMIRCHHVDEVCFDLRSCAWARTLHTPVWTRGDSIFLEIIWRFSLCFFSPVALDLDPKPYLPSCSTDDTQVKKMFVANHWANRIDQALASYSEFHEISNKNWNDLTTNHPIQQKNWQTSFNNRCR